MTGKGGRAREGSTLRCTSLMDYNETLHKPPIPRRGFKKYYYSTTTNVTVTSKYQFMTIVVGYYNYYQ